MRTEDTYGLGFLLNIIRYRILRLPVCYAKI